MFKFDFKQLVLFIFVGLMAVACNSDSNPMGPTIDDGLVAFENDLTVAIIEVENHEDHDDHSDEHANHIGFKLEEDGEETYTYRQLGLQPDGEIILSVGETKEFSVHFLDCDYLMTQSNCELFEECEWHADDNSCEEVGHGEHCDDLADQTACEASDHCEWHADDNSCEDEEHGMHIEITGVGVGSTVFRIRLMHDGHFDYTSVEIPITVVQE